MSKIVSFVVVVCTFISLNAQNIGIGTQAPAAKLEINATMNEALRLRSNNYPFMSFYSGATQKAVLQSTATDNFLIWSQGAGGFAFKTIGANPMYILANGNIGVNESSPTQTLHVTGNARLTGGLYDGNNLVGNSGQILSSTGTSTEWINATGLGGDDWTVSGSDMYPTTATNIGIGTTSPLHPLHIRETGPNQISQDDYTLLIHSSAVTGANADSSVSTKVHLEHGSGTGTALVRAFQAYGQSNSWWGTTTVIGAHAQSNYVFSGGGAPINTHIGVFGRLVQIMQ